MLSSAGNRLFVGYAGLRRYVEKFARVHPRLGLFEHRSRIRLRDNTFADAEAPNIDPIAKALRNLVDEIMFIAFRLHIDIALRPDQSAHVALDAVRIHVAGKHKGHHKGRGDDSPKAMLLQQIELRSPDIYPRYFSRQGSIHARPGRADEFKSNFFRR